MKKYDLRLGARRNQYLKTGLLARRLSLVTIKSWAVSASCLAKSRIEERLLKALIEAEGVAEGAAEVVETGVISGVGVISGTVRCASIDSRVESC